MAETCVICSICKKEISRFEMGRAYQRVLTWTARRKGGGEHGLVSPKRLNEWAHWECVDAELKGLVGQGDLFR